MSEHTPTPWTLGEFPRGVYASMSPGVIVAEATTILRPPAEAAANAAFIVLAVNAHEELVAALDSLTREIHAAHLAGDHDFNTLRSGEHYKAACAALRRARGEA